MKTLTFVPVITFLVAALMLPGWHKGPRVAFSLETLGPQLQQHFDECADLQASKLIEGLTFVTEDHGRLVKVHTNGTLIVSLDVQTGEPISVVLGDGTRLPDVQELRASPMVPGWLQVTTRTMSAVRSTVMHTNGVLQIVEQER